MKQFTVTVSIPINVTLTAESEDDAVQEVIKNRTAQLYEKAKVAIANGNTDISVAEGSEPSSKTHIMYLVYESSEDDPQHLATDEETMRLFDDEVEAVRYAENQRDEYEEDDFYSEYAYRPEFSCDGARYVFTRMLEDSDKEVGFSICIAEIPYPLNQL